jgi:hypothetical protein
MKDEIPRYAPSAVYIVRGARAGKFPVVRYVAHPPGNHPPSCPIRKDLTVLECVTEHGSTWWGFDKVWINSELRMVVQGFDSRDEIRRNWAPACVP